MECFSLDYLLPHPVEGAGELGIFQLSTDGGEGFVQGQAGPEQGRQLPGGRSQFVGGNPLQESGPEGALSRAGGAFLPQGGGVDSLVAQLDEHRSLSGGFHRAGNLFSSGVEAGIVEEGHDQTSSWVTRRTSSMVVSPARAMARPESRRVFIPFLMAAFLILAESRFCSSRSRTCSSTGSSS
jgi:hypothetical protein